MEKKVIWRKGDGEMPENAARIVAAAREERLLRTLRLPEETVEAIRKDANENDQSISDYISTIIIERMKAAS